VPTRSNRDILLFLVRLRTTSCEQSLVSYMILFVPSEIKVFQIALKQHILMGRRVPKNDTVTMAINLSLPLKTSLW